MAEWNLVEFYVDSLLDAGISLEEKMFSCLGKEKKTLLEKLQWQENREECGILIPCNFT